MEVQVVVPSSSSCSSSSSALPIALDTIEVEWKGTKYPISIFEGDTVKELRQRIFEATLVPPPDQKILGPGIKAKLDDTILIKDLKLAKGKSLKMVGTPVSERPPPSPVSSSSSFMGRGYEVTEDQDIHLQDVNKSKIENAIQRVQVKEIFSPPRDGFKLLVLDIDYTLFDHHSFADRAQELVRPYLHEFLTRMYRHYDLMIWSATNYEMIERKMQAFGVTNHPDYKIVCYFASNAMITVYSQKYKITRVKPLKVIWAKFPDRYNAANTIMIDDLRRNFLMNPLNGIKIRSYRSAHLNREMDDELLKVGEYLEDISTLDDLTSIDHRRWRRRLRQKRRM